MERGFDDWVLLICRLNPGPNPLSRSFPYVSSAVGWQRKDQLLLQEDWVGELWRSSAED